jgi:hypothetical protein
MCLVIVNHFSFIHLASAGGCLKSKTSVAEGDSLSFYPQIIPKSQKIMKKNKLFFGKVSSTKT